MPCSHWPGLSDVPSPVPNPVPGSGPAQTTLLVEGRRFLKGRVGATGQRRGEFLAGRHTQVFPFAGFLGLSPPQASVMTEEAVAAGRAGLPSHPTGAPQPCLVNIIGSPQGFC